MLCLNHTVNVREWRERLVAFFKTSHATIFQLVYVTAHRCAGGLKKLNLRSGSQRHRHFVGFFNVPVQAWSPGHPFYTVIPRNRPI